MLEIISGYDKNDSTSLDKPVNAYASFVNKDVKKIKIGIIKESLGEGIDKDVKGKIWDGIKKLESFGIKYEEVSLPLVAKYGIQAYYLIAMSEASTNLAKFCGMRYGISEKLEGSFNEYFTKVRSENFGEEAKRRIIIGTFARMAGYRDAYYIKAMKVRAKIIEEYKKAFKRFDLLVSPTMPIVAPKFSELEKLTPLQNYMMDIMTVGPNLAGLPHLSCPVGFSNKLPVGMLLIGNHLEEGKLIQVGSLLE
jgi:aspartyl-tRNA(Asn)/glutamyl-tRNA(Gln) amidotransferase subunit A